MKMHNEIYEHVPGVHCSKIRTRTRLYYDEIVLIKVKGDALCAHIVVETKHFGAIKDAVK